MIGAVLATIWRSVEEESERPFNWNFFGLIRFPSGHTVEYEQVNDKAIREMGAKE